MWQWPNKSIGRLERWWGDLSLKNKPLYYLLLAGSALVLGIIADSIKAKIEALQTRAILSGFIILVGFLPAVVLLILEVRSAKRKQAQIAWVRWVVASCLVAGPTLFLCSSLFGRMNYTASPPNRDQGTSNELVWHAATPWLNGPSLQRAQDLASSLPTNKTSIEPLAFRQKHESVIVILGKSQILLPPVPEGAVYATKDLGRAFFGAGTYNSPSQIWLIANKAEIVLDITFAPIFGMPPLELKNNELSGLPEDWDCNHNSRGIEIVNEKQIPIFQMYYKDDTHIVVNGVITYTNAVTALRGFVTSGGEGFEITRGTNDMDVELAAKSLGLKPIFKYPAWEHLGEFVDK